MNICQAVQPSTSTLYTCKSSIIFVQVVSRPQLYRLRVSCRFKEQKIQSVVPERWEEKDGVENIVTGGDSDK